MGTAVQGGAGDPGTGASRPRPPEADAFEREYPGSRWIHTEAMHKLREVGLKSAALVAGVARRYGLSHAALNALAVIEGAGGALPAGEVTARMHISTATMTSVLDTLERKGYVQRQPDPDDRRRVLVDITPDAEALLDQLLPAVQQLCTATLESLDDETLHALLDALTIANDALDAAPDDLPPPAPRQTPSHLRRSAR